MSSINTSYDPTDFVEPDLISNCCGAPVYEETDICTDCGEHCDPIPESDSEETLGAMDRW
jgi:hypothetical protein